MQKFIGTVLATALVMISLTGCQSGSASARAGSGFDPEREVAVITREDGSGTRGAFTELLGIRVSFPDGRRKDQTTKEAVVAKQTDVLMTGVARDKYAIGYISFGALGGSVKAVSIDGVAAQADQVKSGEYALARPFIIATYGEVSPLAADFIRFLLSREGQAVASASYIAVDDAAPAYTGGTASGKLVVAGSSSVSPVMEKLKEAYMTLNPHTAVEIQQSDSSSGMTGAIDGTCDIAMSSRELKDSEAQRLAAVTFALDGIAVIVNPENPVENLSSEQVRGIFTGELAQWNEVAQ